MTFGLVTSHRSSNHLFLFYIIFNTSLTSSLLFYQNKKVDQSGKEKVYIMTFHLDTLVVFFLFVVRRFGPSDTVIFGWKDISTDLLSNISSLWKVFFLKHDFRMTDLVRHPSNYLSMLARIMKTTQMTSMTMRKRKSCKKQDKLWYINLTYVCCRFSRTLLDNLPKRIANFYFFRIIYLLSYLDRSNIANAKIGGLEHDIHLTSIQYQWSLSIFFFGYVLFEIPSNIILRRWRPSRWIALIMFSWGS